MANTVAPLSEVGVASMAGDLLDEFNITSLDENTPAARFMARSFGYVRDETLQLYPWHFATKRALLPVLTELPEFGWDYQYNLPTDCIRVHPLKDDGLLDGVDIPHEVENNRILCDVPTEIKIRYTFRQTNLAKWRPLAARVFAARLAMYAATRITGKSEYFAKSQAEFQRAMFEATHADSLERGTQASYSLGEDVFSARGLVSY